MSVCRLRADVHWLSSSYLANTQVVIAHERPHTMDWLNNTIYSLAYVGVEARIGFEYALGTSSYSLDQLALSSQPLADLINFGVGATVGYGMQAVLMLEAQPMRIAEGLYESSAELISKVGGLWDTAELLAKEPLPRSLNNVETRKWYHEQLSQIPDKIDKTLHLREQALQAFKMRNEIKLQARELMADQELASKLMVEQPVKTLKDVAKTAYKDRSLTGDEFWKYIKGSSQRSNKIVDETLGIHKQYNTLSREPGL